MKLQDFNSIGAMMTALWSGRAYLAVSASLPPVALGLRPVRHSLGEG